MCALLCCLNLLLGSTNPRLEKIVCNLEVLCYNCTKADLGNLVCSEESGLFLFIHSRMRALGVPEDTALQV